MNHQLIHMPCCLERTLRKWYGRRCPLRYSGCLEVGHLHNMCRHRQHGNHRSLPQRLPLRSHQVTLTVWFRRYILLFMGESTWPRDMSIFEIKIINIARTPLIDNPAYWPGIIGHRRFSHWWLAKRCNAIGPQTKQGICKHILSICVFGEVLYIHVCKVETTFQDRA